jgi:hypothetical protein
VTASAPDVELSGLVWTYLKRPKLGLPTEAHPCGSVASLTMSSKATGLRG